ncbi:MAG: DUF456 domain-containing protein [bacterium]
MISLWLIILIILTFILIILGLLGLVLPFIPDLPLIWLGIAVYAIFTKFAAISWQLLLALFMLTIVVFLLDFWVGVIGAKTFGASRFGIVGSFLGMFFGLMAGSIPGLLVGAIIGAFLGELFSGRDYQQAVKSGLGTVIGFLAGRVLKMIAAVIMVGIFLVKII